MPVVDSAYTAARLVAVALGLVLLVLLAIMAWRAWQRSRITPEERERRRRVWLVASGKMGDAALVEVHEGVLIYCYNVRGVEYTASQDVSQLGDRVPSDLSTVPAVSVKYDPKNPANSIVVAEEWTGLHVARVR
jgi:hypothetical protein